MLLWHWVPSERRRVVRERNPGLSVFFTLDSLRCVDSIAGQRLDVKKALVLDDINVSLDHFE